MQRSRRISLVAITLMVAAYSSASDLGDRLDRELKGGWGVLEVEVYSACGNTYSDNEVGAAGVASKARNRFAAGELVKIDNALSEAAEAVEDLDDDPEYLAGFGEGSEKMGGFSVTSCDSLLSVSFTSYRKGAPADKSRGWKNGWNDGQKLVFHVLLADRLRSCLVPVPAPLLP